MVKVFVSQTRKHEATEYEKQGTHSHDEQIQGMRYIDDTARDHYDNPRNQQYLAILKTVIYVEMHDIHEKKNLYESDLCYPRYTIFSQDFTLYFEHNHILNFMNFNYTFVS